MHFHYMTYIRPRPSTRTPAPGVMKFSILVDPPLVIITILSVCLLWPIPGTRTRVPGGHEIYHFGRPFLGHHYYLSVSSMPILNKSSILHFPPPNYETDNFLSPYSTDATYQN